MLKVINSLAKRIETKWREVDNNCYKFADIVLKELDEKELIDNFNFYDINNLLDEHEVKNVQIASEFSELHLKLFDNGKFYIEILNWIDNDTSIHDHGFAGVLVQLQGTGINAMYSFEEEEKVSHNLKLGSVKLDKVEISSKGCVRVIPCGREEKHAVFHIEQPTISLIIRTHPITELSPQLNYFPPYVLIDHSATSLIFNKRLKYFRILSRLNKQLFQDQLQSTINSMSYTESYWMLLKLSKLLFDKDHIKIVKQFVNSAKGSKVRRIREKLVTSVYARRMSMTLIDEIKPLLNEREERLLITAIAASYSKDDFGIMSRDLNIGHNKDEVYAILKSNVGINFVDVFNNSYKALT